MYISNSGENMTRDNFGKPAKTSIRFKGVRRHLLTLAKNDTFNGYSVDQIMRYLDTPKRIRPDATNFGLLIGKSRHTINKWLDARAQEREAEE